MAGRVERPGEDRPDPAAADDHGFHAPSSGIGSRTTQTAHGAFFRTYGMVRPIAKSPPNRSTIGESERPAGRRSALGGLVDERGADVAGLEQDRLDRARRRVSAAASATSSTRWASSEPPATSASSGSVQSISTTWTATTSAFVGRGGPRRRRRTIRASLGPPFRASDGALEGRFCGSGTAGGTPIPGVADDDRGRRRDDRAVAVARRSRCAPRSATAVGRLASGRPRGRRSAAGSSRRYGTLTTTVCGRPSSERPQPLRRLVVEDPLPPAAGDVLGDDDERDRLPPCRAARRGRGRRGRRGAARRAPGTATRRRRAGTPGTWRSQRVADLAPPRRARRR